MTTTTNTGQQAPGAKGFEQVKTFHSPPGAVCAALQTTEAISAWWGPITGTAVEGGRFRADFGEGRYHEIVVGSVEPRRVAWTSAAAPHHHGEWEGTTMVFELAAAGEAMLWQSWDAIRCPTLLLRGAESDLLTRATAEAMTQRGPRARLHEFAGVGHAPTLVHPDQIAVVRDFLLSASP